MTVTWNDSEPEFPGLLPPKPAAVKVTQQEAESRIEGVLDAAGIYFSLWAGSDNVMRVHARFPDGAVFSGDYIDLLATGYSRK